MIKKIQQYDADRLNGALMVTKAHCYGDYYLIDYGEYYRIDDVDPIIEELDSEIKSLKAENEKLRSERIPRNILVKKLLDIKNACDSRNSLYENGYNQCMYELEALITNYKEEIK